jgi:hypothetical protein
MSKPIKISLTLNGQEWVDALCFKYLDSAVSRLAYLPAQDAIPVEEQAAAWLREEAEILPAEGATEEELKKFEEDHAKKAAEETEESTTLAKRRGTKMCVYGNGFVNSKRMMVKFSHENGTTKTVVPVFKNAKKIGVEVPDMG